MGTRVVVHSRKASLTEREGRDETRNAPCSVAFVVSPTQDRMCRCGHTLGCGEVDAVSVRICKARESRRVAGEPTNWASEGGEQHGHYFVVCGRKSCCEGGRPAARQIQYIYRYITVLCSIVRGMMRMIRFRFRSHPGGVDTMR